MRPVKINNLDQVSGTHLKSNEKFNFRCHSNLACFNRCCRNLNLFLYPYDVLRLKTCLNIDSDLFLDHYVDIIFRKDNYFPDVLLKMTENEERSCCFLTSKGCNVYLDRPDTCRSFPMEKGMIPSVNKDVPRLVYFFRPPDFCMGDQEPSEHTPRSWTRDQGAETYEHMTILWAELKQMFITDPWGGQGPNGPKGKMAFMTVYNLDRFRQFIFKSSFLSRYRVKKIDLKKIRTDDYQLLLFGFEWIKLFVWGRPSKKIRPN
jgi:Fe-S-cluster containining protein